MTYTIWPITRTDQKTEKSTMERKIEGKKEEKSITEVNIRELISVCESLNKLCETLGRLENAIKRKGIEINLKK